MSRSGRYAATALVLSLFIAIAVAWKYFHPTGSEVRAGDIVFEAVPEIVTQIAYGTPSHTVEMTLMESESRFSVDERGLGRSLKARCLQGGRGADVFERLLSIPARRRLTEDEIETFRAQQGGPLPLLRIDTATEIDPLEWHIVIGGPNHNVVFALGESYGYELELPAELFATLSGGCATLSASR